ncbi:MAG: alpha/beta fold hydrolase [Anaerotardibacter sp.]
MSVVRKEHHLPSSNNESTLHVVTWESGEDAAQCEMPQGQGEASQRQSEPQHKDEASQLQAETPQYRGVVQIVHGMSEHCLRYDHFARFLVEQGFFVLSHDHVGHGQSVSSADELGHIALSWGAETLIQDVHAVRQAFAPKELAYTIFGHSMGSFITRAYLARYGTTVQKAIICGTGNQPRMLSLMGNSLSRLLCRLKGEKAHSPFIHNLADGAYNKSVPNPQTEFDWLSVNPANVEAYIDDPLCGQMFTVGGYAALTSLTKEVVTPEHAAKIPHELPLFFIAGEGDPVGDFGKGVLDAVALYQERGASHITTFLYPEMRHEILNETGNQLVYDDVANWLIYTSEGKEIPEQA